VNPYSTQILREASHAFEPSEGDVACDTDPFEGPALARSVWVRQCTRRLRALRPHVDPALLAAVADEAWAEAASFDPVAAAEMEHLCWA
jgi:hypothetical protein